MDDQDATEFMDDDSQEANSPPPENDQTAYEDAAAGPSVESIDVTTNTRTLGQPLSDFLMTLEDYTPTVKYLNNIKFVNPIKTCLQLQIPDAVTCSYLASSGFEASDPRM